MPPSCHFGMHHQCLVAARSTCRHTSTIGNVTIASLKFNLSAKTERRIPSSTPHARGRIPSTTFSPLLYLKKRDRSHSAQNGHQRNGRRQKGAVLQVERMISLWDAYNRTRIDICRNSLVLLSTSSQRLLPCEGNE